MTTLLAIDTATDACSVALWRNGDLQARLEVVPRRHQERLFVMLADILPDGDLRRAGVEAIAYSSGPGSFTGLRIAASAVQGLAFAHRLPCLPVSSLVCQAQRALREGLVGADQHVFSAIDAAIGELYYAEVRFDGGVAVPVTDPRVSLPGQAALPGKGPLVAVGSGCRFLPELPAALRQRIGASHPDLLPAAEDLLPAALAALARGETQPAEAVCPVYVRDEISWKKLGEQGRRSG